MPSFDLAIVGAGIVGLASAREALRGLPGLRLCVLDKENGIARHQSSHNSGVIHSGIYYRPGSLKASLCVQGAREMLEFCQQRGISHSVCGKLIVATREEELPSLHELRRRAEANDVPGVELLGPERLREVEPCAAGLRALRVPGTAVTDYAAVCSAFADDVRNAGGEIRTAARVTGLARRPGEIVVRTSAGEFTAAFVLNCAGLHSDRVAAMAGLQTRLRIVPFRGEYYELSPERAHLVRALLYPVPDPHFPFLGIHFTRGVRGRVEAGPNAVLAFKREGYRHSDFSFAEAASTLTHPGFWKLARRHWRFGASELYRSFSRTAFLRELQRLLPELRFTDLSPGGSGVRAQAVDEAGNLLDDFQFLQAEGMVHVLNVPSPAATASLPIARKIVAMATSAGLVSRN